MEYFSVLNRSVTPHVFFLIEKDKKRELHWVPGVILTAVLTTSCPRARSEVGAEVIREKSMPCELDHTLTNLDIHHPLGAIVLRC